MEPDVVITLPADASPDLIERLADAFPDAQIDQPAPPVAEYSPPVDEAFAEVIAAAPGMPGAVATWWAALPSGGAWVLLMIAVSMVIGGAAAWLAARALPERPTGDEDADFRTRLPRGLWHLCRGLASVAIFAVVATLAHRLIGAGDRDISTLFRNLLESMVRFGALFVLFEALAAPGARWRRLMGFDEAGARTTLRAALVTMSILLVVALLRDVIDAAVGTGDTGAMFRLVAVLINGGVIAAFFLRVDKPVGRVILSRFDGVEQRIGWSDWPARNWVWFYVAAVVIDMLMKAVGILGLLGPRAAAGTGAAINILVLAPLAIAGLSVWNREAAAAAAEEGRRRGGAVGMFALAEGLVIVVAGGLLMRAWGVDPLNPPQGEGVASLIPGLVEAAVVLVASFAVWRALNALLTPTPLPEESESLSDEELASRHRLATILPVIRGFALALLAVMAAMTALSSLGVDIAPLLASAGVLGLAIGFGAQRLVADVISGVLFLYEDAFRVGEYIEAGGGKGAVERISLRSVRLRHPRGPVFTIPFSDLGMVENHSRDYATMKFSFAVPSSVDVEKVRKLIKKAGAEMMDDPEVKDFILEPLKSQGTLSIQGPSYIIGCKFTAKPGKQFIVRRKAYVAIQKALADNGIELFEPQLTINPADPGGRPVPMDASGQPQAAQPAMVLDRG